MRVRLMFLLLPTLIGSPGISAAQSSQQPRDAKPAFSITLRTRQTVLEVGSPLRVRIAVTNTSDHDIVIGPPVQISVLDSEAKPVPETPYGMKVHGTEPRPAPPPEVGPPQGVPGPGGGGLGPLPMRPGETSRGSSGDLSREYDLSKPGTYTIQAREADFYSGSVVESNVLTVTLVGSTQATERPKTSFTLTIYTDQDTVSVGDKFLVIIEVTNTSDHEIVYDTAITMLDIQVRDAQGNLATLTESGRSLRKEFGSSGGPQNLFHLKPGDTLRGGGRDRWRALRSEAPRRLRDPDAAIRQRDPDLGKIEHRHRDGGSLKSRANARHALHRAVASG